MLKAVTWLLGIFVFSVGAFAAVIFVLFDYVGHDSMFKGLIDKAIGTHLLCTYENAEQSKYKTLTIILNTRLNSMTLETANGYEYNLPTKIIRENNAAIEASFYANEKLMHLWETQKGIFLLDRGTGAMSLSMPSSIIKSYQCVNFEKSF
jgi:hypothetical protein